MYRILIAENNNSLKIIGPMLRHAGYAVYTAREAEEVLKRMEEINPHLLVLDMLLPPLGGIALCQTLRANPKTVHIPILFLTNRQNAPTAADALAAGGDDYIRRPFVARELLARIRAHLRWVPLEQGQEPPLLRINPRHRRIFIQDREADLTRAEYNLLTHLCQNPFHWHAAEELLMAVWKYPVGVGDTALVRNHVRNLRRKLEQDPDHPVILQARHGRGYAICAQTQLVDEFSDEKV